MQDVQYTNDWADMTSNNTPINTAITIPVTAILDTPMATTNDDGEADYYNFEYTFGPNIFPLLNRRNMIMIQFNATDGKAFFAPRIICEVM